MNLVNITREATEEEQQAINKAIEVLEQAGLELVGTRPRDRG